MFLVLLSAAADKEFRRWFADEALDRLRVTLVPRGVEVRLERDDADLDCPLRLPRAAAVFLGRLVENGDRDFDRGFDLVALFSLVAALPRTGDEFRRLAEDDFRRFELVPRQLEALEVCLERDPDFFGFFSTPDVLLRRVGLLATFPRADDELCRVEVFDFDRLLLELVPRRLCVCCVEASLERDDLVFSIAAAFELFC